MLYIVRHAETQYNVDSKYQGISDSPLTERGLKQAEQIGNFLKTKINLSNAQIVCSPSKRCIQTINLCRLSPTLKIVYDGLLVEQNFGVWEKLTQEEVIDAFPASWEELKKKRDFFKPLYGESFEEAKLRAKEWLQFNFLDDPRKTTIVFTHKKISIALGQLLILGKSHSDHKQDSIYEIDVIEPRYIEHDIWERRCQ